MTSATSPTSLPPVPDSPTGSFTSTAVPASSLNLPLPSAPPLPRDILSRADTMLSVQAYENLLETAKGYRKSLAAVAGAASEFGAALEGFARCRAAGDNAQGVLNAGGLQFLIATSTHILSEILYRGFEVPLLHELDSYKEKLQENEERYRKELKKKSTELKRKEGDHLRLAKQKQRNMAAYRSALVDLTLQIDELDKLKYDHYHVAHSLAQEASNKILDCSSLVVRAEVEIFEKVAQKGWDSSGGLDDLIARSPDPFAPENRDGDNEVGTIFSILPAQSILPSPQSPSMVGTVTSKSISRSKPGRESEFTDIGGGKEASNTEGYIFHGEAAGQSSKDHLAAQYGHNLPKYQSLTGRLSLNGDYTDYEDEDVHSVFSGGFSGVGTSTAVETTAGNISPATGERHSTLSPFSTSIWATRSKSQEGSEVGGETEDEDSTSTVETMMRLDLQPNNFSASKDSESEDLNTTSTDQQEKGGTCEASTTYE